MAEPSFPFHELRTWETGASELGLGLILLVTSR